uniref:Uncharacterized protein n=1 Tax=Oryza brachyantha TaxID=4533 RepID=J3L7B6_ORYBR
MRMAQAFDPDKKEIDKKKFHDTLTRNAECLGTIIYSPLPAYMHNCICNVSPCLATKKKKISSLTVWDYHQ